MNNIAICIPTFKRPVMLRKLVLSIAACELNSSLIGDVNIVIVDNDACFTAESIVNELKKNSLIVFQISYINYPVKGLSNVRNELLRNGLLLNADFLVFVDDDEFVSPDWLNELVETIIVNNGDMAMGPVVSLLDNNVKKYISCWIEREFHLNNAKLNYLRTGNLIIRRNSLLKLNIWFDPKFNKTGGEDSYFGIQMIKKGAKIYWANNAVVYETVPGNRANIIWLVKRYYNGANIYTFILKVEKEYFKLFGKVIISLLYVFLGVGAFILLPFPFQRRYWGPLKLSEGLGGIAGFLSIRYNEYE
jgi:succinoglycan biosynthesis protein ExoM